MFCSSIPVSLAFTWAMRPGSRSFTATSSTKMLPQATSWIRCRRSPGVRVSRFPRWTPVRRSRGTPPPPFRRPMLGRDGADPPPNVPCRHDAPPLSESIPNSMRRPGGICVFGESSAPPKETGKGLPSQSLALARFAGRYPSRPSIAAHRAVLSRMEGMRTRSSVVWICSAMAERASTVGTP